MIRISDRKGDRIMAVHDDAGILVIEDTRMRLYMPDGVDENNPPAHLVFMTVLAAFVRSEDGRQILSDWAAGQTQIGAVADAVEPETGDAPQ
jgi:hypothetical protein